MRKHKDRSFVKWQTYWYLTVIEPNEILNWKQKVLVKCKCWTEKYVQLNNLLATWSNRVFSCWCMRWELISKHKTIHWMRWTMWIYNIYKWMCYRCNNKNWKDYKRYWWRWIKVLWKDFIEFYNDMSESYYKHCEELWVKNTTIDRIDVNWNYCKENCRRVTMKEQCNNKRNNFIIEYKWQQYTLQQLSCKLDVQRTTLKARIDEWKDIDYMLSKYDKNKYKHKQIEYKWWIYTIAELWRMFNVDPSWISKKLKQGKTIYDIFWY
jgi:hypothetical protein